jgi:hypothetical protein
MKTAEQEKAELAKLLRKEMGLELSESKTKITPVTSPMSFLGFTIRVQYNPKSRWISKLVIPRSKSHKIRQAIKLEFRHFKSACRRLMSWPFAGFSSSAQPIHQFGVEF